MSAPFYSPFNFRVLMQSFGFRIRDTPVFKLACSGISGLVFSFLCVKWPNKLLGPPLLPKALYRRDTPYIHRRSHLKPTLKGLEHLII